jgi:hypothetical protein
VSGEYGSDVAGPSCTGNDSKTEENNLEVKITWQQGNANPTTITARSRMTDRTYAETLTDIDCPQGPPSWTGTATITVSVPGIGTGGGSGTAGTWTVNLGGGAQQGQPLHLQWVSMNAYNWDIDPEDPGTFVKFVSAKVTASLNGTVVEADVLSVNKAKCHLEVQTPAP